MQYLVGHIDEFMPLNDFRCQVAVGLAKLGFNLLPVTALAVVLQELVPVIFDVVQQVSHLAHECGILRVGQHFS